MLIRHRSFDPLSDYRRDVGKLQKWGSARRDSLNEMLRYSIGGNKLWDTTECKGNGDEGLI